MNHRESNAVDSVSGDFCEAGAHVGPIVVAPHADKALRTGLEFGEEIIGHPVTRVKNDVSPLHLAPYLRRERSRTLGNVSVSEKDDGSHPATLTLPHQREGRVSKTRVDSRGRARATASEMRSLRSVLVTR